MLPNTKEMITADAVVASYRGEAGMTAVRLSKRTI